MLTVLIVDDEPLVRNMVRHALSQNGYAVLDATGKTEVTALCASLGDERIDLLIIDHVLAPDTGRAVAELIVEVYSTTKVLVISGHTYQTVQNEDGLLPGSSFLQKPFTPQRLLSAVQTIMHPSTH